MSKSVLSLLPEPSLRQTPGLSGICPSKAIVLLFLAAIPISLILGVVAHYLGVLLASIGLGLLTVSSANDPTIGIHWGFIGNLLGFIIMVAMLGYPFLIGYLEGHHIVAKMALLGHCRNVRLAGLAGALNGILLYLGHIAISWITLGKISSLILPLDIFEKNFDTPITGTPWWIFIPVTFEFVVLVIMAGKSTQKTLKEAFYCETHNSWYGDWSTGLIPFSSAQALIEAFRSMDVSPLKNIDWQQSPAFPRVSLQMRACSTDPSCDMQMTAKVMWEEEVRTDKGTSTLVKTEPWFDLMLSAGLGQELEKTLKLTKPEPKKKKTKNGAIQGSVSQQPIPARPSTIVKCSKCGKSLLELPEISYMKAAPGLKQWLGNVCLSCKRIYCNDCIEVGRSTPCPNCGQPTEPAQLINLQKIGIGENDDWKRTG